MSVVLRDVLVVKANPQSARVVFSVFAPISSHFSRRRVAPHHRESGSRAGLYLVHREEPCGNSADEECVAFHKV